METETDGKQLIYNVMMCLLLLFSLMNISLAWGITPSPAGGNYLSLNGKDEYAVVDFEKAGALLDEKTTKLTVEAWVYPISPPEKSTLAVILGQQLLFYVINNEDPFADALKKDSNFKWDKKAYLRKYLEVFLLTSYNLSRI